MAQYSYDLSVVRLWSHLLDLPKTIGWTKNAVVYRVLFREVEDGWQAIVKARRGKTFGVAYCNGRTFALMVENLALMLKAGDLDWKVDKYPPRT